MKKYTINEMKGKLSNNRNIFISKKTKGFEKLPDIIITIFRLDLSKIGKKINKETYRYILEKYDSNKTSFGEYSLEFKKDFYNLDDLFKYMKNDKSINKVKKVLIHDKEIPINSKGKLINILKKELLNGNRISIPLNNQTKRINYNLDINIWRLDTIPSIKTKYVVETYVLTIEKYNSKYQSTDTDCLVDLRVEFKQIEEIIDYLDKNNFIRKKEWIIT